MFDAPTMGLARSEVRLFARQRVMIAVALLVPAGLLGMAAFVEEPGEPGDWARMSGYYSVAILCVTVYFVSLNTLTARRQTLALKRFRTSSISDIGILIGVLTPAATVGMLQTLILYVGLVLLGSPFPNHPLLVGAAMLSGIAVAILAGIVTSAVTVSSEKAQWTMVPLFVLAMAGASALVGADDQRLEWALRAIPLVANADIVSRTWAIDADSGVMGRVAADFAIVGLWVVVLAVAAKRLFRWDSRR